MLPINKCYPYKWKRVHSFLNGEYFLGRMEFTFLNKIMHEAMGGEKLYYLQPVGGDDTQRVAWQTLEFRKRLKLNRLDAFFGGTDYATYGSVSIYTNPPLIYLRFSGAEPENIEIIRRVEEILQKNELIDNKR